MITRIRDVRKAKRMTLHEVAAACVPPTTAQTIGRLETGTRTVSVAWLNRIAAALGVTAAELVTLPDRADVAVAAVLGPDGAAAPRRTTALLPPLPEGDLMGLVVEVAQGDYRAGDAVWLERLEPAAFVTAMNRDILVPRAASRFAFGRLAGVEGRRLQILPAEPGARQIVIADAPWIGVVRALMRSL
ncbi:MAG: helix-turn-helix transcriptional regulator [Sphingomonadaceae bacterium]|nr:helix-turn-helix transcriptional regulator [Sphingomonadaceae bacterium]